MPRHQQIAPVGYSDLPRGEDDRLPITEVGSVVARHVPNELNLGRPANTRAKSVRRIIPAGPKVALRIGNPRRARSAPAREPTPATDA